MQLKASAHALKHVLNTRLTPAFASILEVRRDGEVRYKATKAARDNSWLYRAGRMMRQAAFSETDTECALGEGEQLPPIGDLPRSPSPTLEQLYRKQASRLARYFSRRVERQDALDLVHEAFARMAGLGQSGSTIVDRPEAYLGTIATNLLRDRARAAARRANDHLNVDPDSSSNEDPHGRLEQRDVVARLDEALATLPSRRREIFLLHRLEHLTYAEIGRVVGMSEKGVKKQMAKTLYQLRRELGRN